MDLRTTVDTSFTTTFSSLPQASDLANQDTPSIDSTVLLQKEVERYQQKIDKLFKAFQQNKKTFPEVCQRVFNYRFDIASKYTHFTQIFERVSQQDEEAQPVQTAFSSLQTKLETQYQELIVNLKSKASSLFAQKEYAGALKIYESIIEAMQISQINVNESTLAQASKITCFVNQEKLDEAIASFLVLSDTQHESNWYNTTWQAFNRFIIRYLRIHEEEFNNFRRQATSYLKDIGDILSPEKITCSNMKNFKQYLASCRNELETTQESLKDLLDNFTETKNEHELFLKRAERFRLISIDEENASFKITDTVTQQQHCSFISTAGITDQQIKTHLKLCETAINHLNDLLEASDFSDITDNITDYLVHQTANKTVDKNAKHDIWAIAITGKLFFSGEVTDNSLEKIVDTFRNHIVLLSNAQYFVNDIQICFSNITLQVPALLLAIISDYIFNDYLQQVSIKKLHFKDNSLESYTHSFKKFVPFTNKKLELPKVILSSVTEAQSPLLQHTLLYFKNKQHDNSVFSNLKKVTFVALFELLDTLQVPHAIMTQSEIADLIFSPEKIAGLDAELYLRYLQARRDTLPYPEVERRFKNDINSLAGLIQWLDIYDSEKLTLELSSFSMIELVLNKFNQLIANNTSVPENAYTAVFNFISPLYIQACTLSQKSSYFEEHKPSFDKSFIHLLSIATQFNNEDIYELATSTEALDFVTYSDFSDLLPFFGSSSKNGLKLVTPILQSLKHMHVTNLDQTILEHLTDCKSLQSLTIENIDSSLMITTTDSITSLSKNHDNPIFWDTIAKSLPKLNKLTFIKCRVLNLNGISKVKQLRALTVNSVEANITLMPLINSSIKFLRLEATSFIETDLNQITALFSKLETLIITNLQPMLTLPSQNSIVVSWPNISHVQIDNTLLVEDSRKTSCTFSNFIHSAPHATVISILPVLKSEESVSHPHKPVYAPSFDSFSGNVRLTHLRIGLTSTNINSIHALPSLKTLRSLQLFIPVHACADVLNQLFREHPNIFRACKNLKRITFIFPNSVNTSLNLHAHYDFNKLLDARQTHHIKFFEDSSSYSIDLPELIDSDPEDAMKTAEDIYMESDDSSESEEEAPEVSGLGRLLSSLSLTPSKQSSPTKKDKK